MVDSSQFSKVLITSDLHFGNEDIAIKLRGFNNTKEHDNLILQNLKSELTSESLLIVLGDIEDLNSIIRLSVSCKHIVMILGNHDKIGPPILGLPKNVEITGPNYLDGKYILSHFPIHECSFNIGEGVTLIGNFHGHIHKPSKELAFDYNPETPNDDRYTNVNVEFHDFKPLIYKLN